MFSSKIVTKKSYSKDAQNGGDYDSNEENKSSIDEECDLNESSKRRILDFIPNWIEIVSKKHSDGKIHIQVTGNVIYVGQY